MAGIERFEDIKGWQVARELTCQVYMVSAHGEFARDFGLRDQMRRAAVSVMANVAEGFGSGANPEFVRFLNYAARSAAELQSHLYVALDQRYISQQQFEQLYRKAADAKHLLGGLIRYLQHHKQ